MSHQQLHPDVEAFKRFVNKHPPLLAEIRKSGQPIQAYYERWEKNKENDPMWQDYTESKQAEADPTLLDHITTISKHIDLNKIEGYVSQFQKTLQMAQLLLGDVNEKQDTPKDDTKQTGPFHIFRD